MGRFSLTSRISLQLLINGMDVFQMMQDKYEVTSLVARLDHLYEVDLLEAYSMATFSFQVRRKMPKSY